MSDTVTVDFKSAHILAFGGVVDAFNKGEIASISLPKKVALMIVTHSAAITANILDTAPNTTDENGNLNFNSDEARKLVINSVNKEVAALFSGVNGITAPINLKNVTIRSFSNPNEVIKLDFLCLYSDQVLGISLVQID